MIKINEIFFSIQGESTYVGSPTVFIRTSGCNLRCHYCDTKYAYFEGEWLSQEKILQKVKSFNPAYVCVTGGEPLLQKEIFSLLQALCDQGYRVSLETSGSVSCKKVDQRVKLILDVKTPDSGAANSFLNENFEYTNEQTEFKFVITSEQDFHWAQSFSKDNNLFENYVVLYSPAFNEVKENWLAKKILLENSPARLQLQLHKYIWSPSARGV